MAPIVYLMCALTSTGCAYLLFRNHIRSKARLLLWGALCFGCLALSNIVLFFDLGVLPPSTDLSHYRDGLTFIGLAFFTYGLIWESK